MNESSQGLREGIKYNLSLKDGNVKDCIYEGISGNGHCFTTKQNDDVWEYYFLVENDFRVKNSKIEVLTNQPEITPISRLTEPVEFAQIEMAWNEVMGANRS